MENVNEIFKDLSSWWPSKDKDGKFWAHIRTKTSTKKMGPYVSEQAAVIAVDIALEKALKANNNILATVE